MINVSCEAMLASLGLEKYAGKILIKEYRIDRDITGNNFIRGTVVLTACEDYTFDIIEKYIRIPRQLPIDIEFVKVNDDPNFYISGITYYVQYDGHTITFNPYFKDLTLQSLFIPPTEMGVILYGSEGSTYDPE